MAVNPNEDTEFNDALRKHGILPPKESTPPSPPPPSPPNLVEVLEDYDLKELQELTEDAEDDETERIIARYHQRRIAEEKRDSRRARFGRVYPIGREDYTREVTEASNINEEDDEDEKGTGVICFLYKDGLPRSDRAFQHIHTLAQRYPRTKFVSIVGNKCIPDLPDARVPMILVYRKGEIKQQLIAWGADRERRLEEMEGALTVALDPSERPKARSRDSDSEREFDDLDDEPSSRMRSAVTTTNGPHRKNIRSSTKKDDVDSDSDFEFDL